MNGIGLAKPISRSDDHFLLSLIHALAYPLIQNGMTLVTKVVDNDEQEKRLYRYWAKVGGIAGVVLLGARQHDSRVTLLRSLGVPFVATVDANLNVDFPAVVVKLGASISVLKTFLDTRPHRRTVCVTGPSDHISELYDAVMNQTVKVNNPFEVVRTEHSAEAAVAAGIIAIANDPVTLVFDNDVHAVAALAEFRSRNLRVPNDVAIVSWTNSTLCQGASQSITAIDRRGSEIGSLLGAKVIGAIAGDLATHDLAPDPVIVVGETA